MNDIFYVYIHRRKSDGVPFYIGKGKLRRAWCFAHRNEYWNRVREKHGVTVEICSRNMSEPDAFLLEMWLIAKFKHEGVALTNMTEGGDGVTGIVFSPSEIERRRAYATGRKMTEETKAKTRAAKIGKKRENMSGARHPCYDKNIYTFVNNDSIFVGSSYVLSEVTGHDNREIRKVARGARRVYKGWSVLP